jgi:hypothetical protein
VEGLTYDVDLTWPRDFGGETERKAITMNADRTRFTLPFYHRSQPGAQAGSEPLARRDDWQLEHGMDDWLQLSEEDIERATGWHGRSHQSRRLSRFPRTRLARSGATDRRGNRW